MDAFPENFVGQAELACLFRFFFSSAHDGVALRERNIRAGCPSGTGVAKRRLRLNGIFSMKGG
jgi:hypothetical protein